MIVYRQQHVSGLWWPLACPMCRRLRAQNVMAFTTGRARALATNPISTLTSAHLNTGDASETGASLHESTFSAVQSVPVRPLETSVNSSNFRLYAGRQGKCCYGKCRARSDLHM